MAKISETTNDAVKDIKLLQQISREVQLYKSITSISDTSEALANRLYRNSIELLKSFPLPSTPLYRLQIKPEASDTLLRNLDFQSCAMKLVMLSTNFFSQTKKKSHSIWISPTTQRDCRTRVETFSFSDSWHWLTFPLILISTLANRHVIELYFKITRTGDVLCFHLTTCKIDVFFDIAPMTMFCQVTVLDILHKS